MKLKTLVAFAAVLAFAVTLSAQNNETGFDKFKKEREADYGKFAKDREEEFRKFKARYENAFARFKSNYMKALREEEGIVDLMASDDDMPIVPVSGKIQQNIYPVVSTSGQEKQIIKRDIEAVSRLTSDRLLPVLSDSEDTVDRMRQAAEVMEVIAGNLEASPVNTEEPQVMESVEVVLEPYSGQNAAGTEVKAQALDSEFLAMLKADAARAQAEQEVRDNPVSVPEERPAAAVEVAVAGRSSEETSVESSIPHGSPTEYVRISSPFGTRIHPITRKRHTHKGVDMAAPRMTPIYASADGTITFAKSNGGYGKFVKINHGNGYKTAYAHMQKIAVKKGDQVRRGDLIGYVGSTGRSTGNHLHYEVYYQDKLINPADTL